MDKMIRRTATSGYCLASGYTEKDAFKMLYAYQDTGYTPADIADLAVSKATAETIVRQYEEWEKEGTIIRLPCKVGDTVYQITKLRGDSRFLPFINRHIITAINTSHRRKGFGAVFYWEGDLGTHTFKLNDFGKTVFLTRAEAEAALTKEGKQ